MERGRDRADLAVARRYSLARRQALHGPGRPVHLWSADREIEREAPDQSSQVLVEEPRSRHRQRRLRSHLSSEATTARLSYDARRRVFADLSLPRGPARHAQPSDRHWPVQIRRVQAERTNHGNEKPGLLEGGTTLSRQHRVYDHTQPVD